MFKCTSHVLASAVVIVIINISGTHVTRISIWNETEGGREGEGEQKRRQRVRRTKRPIQLPTGQPASQPTNISLKEDKLNASNAIQIEQILAVPHQNHPNSLVHCIVHVSHKIRSRWSAAECTISISVDRLFNIMSNAGHIPFFHLHTHYLIFFPSFICEQTMAKPCCLYW